MPTLRRPASTLFYDDLGDRDAPAVVLMHSLLCDGTMFAHLADDLAKTWRVLNLDLRGHGRSTPSSRFFTLCDLADDLIALLDHADVRRAALVGLSMGGMTAMRAAIYHPRRVAALALLDTSAEPETSTNRARYMAMATAFRVGGVLPVIAQRLRPLFFSDSFLRRDPAAVEALLRRIGALDRDGVFKAVEAVCMREDITRDLAEIRLPSLVLVGEDDRATNVRRARTIVDGIQGASLDVVKETGHLSTIEQPELTTHIVRAFLEGVGRW